MKGSAGWYLVPETDIMRTIKSVAGIANTPTLTVRRLYSGATDVATSGVDGWGGEAPRLSSLDDLCCTETALGGGGCRDLREDVGGDDVEAELRGVRHDVLERGDHGGEHIQPFNTCQTVVDRRRGQDPS